MKITFLLLSILLWPINLYANNTLIDFLSYIIPAILIGFSISLSIKKVKYYALPILLIPLFSAKLSIFPLVFFVIVFIQKKEISTFCLIIISFIILLSRWQNFYGQTILVPDYQKRQEILRNITLYADIPTARLFQNKPKIVSDKYLENLLTLIDPNNYFFGNSPRPVVGNQNLVKFPYVLLPFIVIAFIKNGKFKYSKILLTFMISSFLSLSTLTNFDRQDFILWPTLSLLFIVILYEFVKEKYRFINLYYAIALLITLATYKQIFL